MSKVNKENKGKEAMLSRLDALKALQGTLNKEFGQGSIIIGNDVGDMKIQSIPTGSIQLDDVIGVGGVPRGRIVEIYGPESAGKTTVALSIIAEAQRAGGVVGFIDAEHALDRGYAQQLGVDLDSMLINQPDNGEQALDILERLVESGHLSVIVVDSVAALTPKSEIEGEMGDSSVGVQARLLSKACRKLTGIIQKSNTTVIFINQIRMKIGVMFGSPETTSGGNALKFYASLRLDVRRSEAIKEGEGEDAKQIGHIINVKLVKNKVGRPAAKVSIPLIYGLGFDRIGEVYGMAKEMGVLEVSGGSHSFEGEKVAKSRAEMNEVLRQNHELFQKVEAKVQASLVATKAAEAEALQARRNGKAS